VDVKRHLVVGEGKGARGERHVAGRSEGECSGEGGRVLACFLISSSVGTKRSVSPMDHLAGTTRARVGRYGGEEGGG
jgi:hypothetical protein